MNSLAYDIEWEVKQIQQAIDYYEDAKRIARDREMKKRYETSIINLQNQLRDLKYEEYKVGYV